MESTELDPAYAQFRDQTRFWIQRVAVPMIMVIGLFGNLITVVIMTRRRMRSTTNMYLAALAFVDMLYLVLTFLLGLSHYPNMAACKYYAYWRMRPFLMMLTDACSNSSVWLTVTFTIERYIAVKYPMRGKVWCTEARAKMLIICVFVLGFVFAAPVPFEWKVIEKRVPKTSSSRLDEPQTVAQNSSKVPYETGQISVMTTETVTDNEDFFMLALDYSDFGKNETYKTIYYRSTAVIFYFIPLFSLMLFNGFLIRSVHQSSRERSKMTAGATSCKATHRRSSFRQVNSNLTTSQANRDEVRENLQSKRRKKRKSRKFRLIFLSSGSRVPKKKDNLNQGSPARGHLTNKSTHLTPIADHTIDNVTSPMIKNLDVQKDCDNNSFIKGDNNSLEFEMTISNDTSIQKLQATKSSSRESIKTNQDSSALCAISKPLSTFCPSLLHQQTGLPIANQERRITIMLIAVVILFLVCQVPSAAMLLYTSVHDIEPNTNEHALVLAFGNIFNFLMAVNAAGNFILYSFLSKKYRRTFMIIFCNCFNPRRNRKQEPLNRMVNMRYDQTSNRNVCTASIRPNQINKLNDKLLRDNL